MKLNRFNPANIRVRGGGSASGGGSFPGGGGGKIGCGTIIIAAIAYFAFGADPMQTIGAIGEMQDSAPTQQTSADGAQGTEACNAGPYALEACNALGSLNETWQPLFQKANIPFEQPVLTLFSGSTRSGCGAASSAMGPFYCPNDQGIYIDTAFYDTMERQLGAGGDFARYYVMAHEYGHHIQKMTGLADQIRSAQSQNPRRSNELQVRMELQADCYAGVWAGLNRNLIEPGDMEEGMTAASAIGDDTLQRSAGQRVSPESFTHGTSSQRMSWLKRGLQSGDEDQCDTFADLKD